MKLFVLGYNKTGTKSLAKALEILGYNVLHTGGGGEFLEKVGWKTEEVSTLEGLFA